MSETGAAFSTYSKVLREVQEEFPQFVIMRKSESWLMKAADLGLKIITFWRMTTFMTTFITTVGDKMYVPDSWFDGNKDVFSKAVTLRHERVHFRQQRRMGRWLFTFKYFWFPAVWAKGRRDIEQEAYAESLLAWAEYVGIHVLKDEKLKQNIVNHFLSADYFWTWPWREDIESWYDEIATGIHVKLTGN